MPAALVPRKGIGFRGIPVSYLNSIGAISFSPCAIVAAQTASSTVNTLILLFFIFVLVLGMKQYTISQILLNLSAKIQIIAELLLYLPQVL